MSFSLTLEANPGVLGYMRSTVTLLGTAMPFPLPDLARLAGASEEERHFSSLGLMGGFELELFEGAEGQPYIVATQSGRQWGTFQNAIESPQAR